VASGTTAMVDDVVIESDDDAILSRHVLQDPDFLAQEEKIDIRYGAPDYNRMWVNESRFQNTVCKGDQLCGREHHCVRCRSEATKRKYNDGHSVERIAAHMIYASQQPSWNNVELDMISDYINTLFNNMSYDKVLVKELSRFGAVRISDIKLVDEAIQQNLKSYDVWIAESGGQRYYMATYDATNIVYAS